MGRIIAQGSVASKPAGPVVCPEKADVLSGSQSRRGKSRNPVAWMAGRRETECLKPIDTVILGVAGESPGRNASERSGGPEIE
jgi:hypothetical protein